MDAIEFATDLSMKHPHVGLLLLKGGYLKPIAIPVEFEFTDTTNLEVVEGSTKQVIDTFMWVTAMSYVVERPNFATGSILKGLSDWYNSLDPYVDLSIKFSGPRGFANLYTIETDNCAIATLCPTFNETWPEGWMIWPQQAPLLRAQNRRVFVDTELPYRVRWTMKGKQIIVPADIYRTVVETDLGSARAACLGGIKDIASKIETAVLK